MSEKQDDAKCSICANFEPQAWRKTICKNCFHTQKEHEGGGDAASSTSDKTKPTEKKEPTIKEKVTEKIEKTKTIDTTDKGKPSAAASGTKAKGLNFGVSFGEKSSDASKTDKSKDSAGKLSSLGKTTDTKPKTTSNGKGVGAISSIASKFTDGSKPKTGNVSVSSKFSKDSDKSSDIKPSVTSSSVNIDSVSSDKSSKVDTEKHSTKEAEHPSSDESKSDSGARAPAATGSSFSFVKRLSKSFSEDEASSDAQESSTIPTKDQQVADKSGSLSGDTQSKSQSPEKKPAAPKTSSASVSTAGKAISSISSKFLSGKQNNQKEKEKDSLKTNNKPKEKDKDLEKTSPSKSTGSFSPKSALKHVSKTNEGKDKDEKKGSTVSINRSNSCPSPKQSLRHLSLTNRDKDKNGSSKSSGSSSPKSSLRNVSTARDSQEKAGSPKSSPSPKSNVRPTFPKSNDKEKDSSRDSKPPLPPSTNHNTVQTEFDDKGEIEKLRKEISKLEEQCKKMEEDKKSLLKETSQKEEFKKNVDDLKLQLKAAENKCSRLESENKNLSISLKENQKKKEADDKKMDTSISLRQSEDTCESLRQSNLLLQQEIREMKQEMDEMYDQFRESEAEEYRDLQKELELTSKNCRILQFKLRKTERRNEQVESDRQHYEEKIRTLQNQFEDNDAKQHIQTLEEELKMAKDVSVRLHDELDILEDRRGRLEDENTKLQELLTKQDKKEFRMEMEIDKLTDRLDELQQQLIKAKRHVEDHGPEDMERTQRRPVLQAQVSSEYEVSQILRDLYDSIERENDLKDQLHFTEEETKLTRKKLKEMEDENENLNFQLKKMSSTKTVMTVRKFDMKGKSTDIDIEPSECEMQLKLELDLSEQENSVLRKKLLDMEQENETYLEEIATLAKRISDKEKEEAILPPPSSPNAYYEDKMKELTTESDDLKWKLIEKEREIERLKAEKFSFSSRSQSKLMKSKSLDGDFQILDLKRQLDLVTQDADATRKRAKILEEENGKLADDIKRLKLQATRQIPSIHADDAAVENIELRDKVKKLEEEKTSMKKKLRIVTDNIHSLTKDVIKGKQLSEHESKALQFSSQLSHETEEELRLMEEEATVLRRKMAELESENTKLFREVEKLKCKSDNVSKAAESPTVTTEDTDDGKTVLELREKINDMKDEISDLLLIVKRREETNNQLEKEIMDLKKGHVDLKDEFRKTEMELLQDLEMAQQKSDVLSNLLDLVSERAEATEKELERVINETTPCPSSRSASAVSALSDASTGSDDVFLSPPSPTGDRPVIAKDWENQFKKRVECLERLLAEERHKVCAAEKKLSLVSDETLSSAMSDDVKLRLREKEILQRELVENQRHLVIANDQIKGLRDRVQCAEESHHKIRMDYEALVRELDRREELEEQISSEQGGNSGISTLQGLHEELRRYKEIVHNVEQSGEMELEAQSEIEQLKRELAKYKLRSEELQYKVEEINEIWVSKSAASEKEKKNLEIQYQTLKNDLAETKEAHIRLQNEVKQKENLLLASDQLLREKDKLVTKRDEIIQQQEDIIKNRDGDFQTMLEQISQRDENLRELREALSIRDERLREKDDIIQMINVKLEGVSKETATELKSSPITDTAKENGALNLHINELHQTIAQLKTEIDVLRSDTERMRKEISSKEYTWQLDKSNLITEMKTYKEKFNLLESMGKIPESDLVLRLSEDCQKLTEEKETLLGEVRKLQLELDNTIESAERDKDELNRKLTDRNKTIEENLLFAERVQNEAARLRSQAELAYRLQQEEKILKAELLAMKVRYETRLEKLQREYNKLHSSAEKIQRERDLDKDIIRGIQRGMGELKARYTKDVASWQNEKLQLEKKVKEIEDGRRMVHELKKLAEDLKKRVVEQERIRANTVNTFNMEKTAWEIEKSNMQSKINQLEEKLSTKTHTRGRDNQTKLEVTWEKERSEQKRLITEAHNLALDLQQQLKSRDEASANDIKDLKQNFEEERSTWMAERKESEKKIQELEGYTRRISDLQKQFQEVKDRDNSEKEAWQKEKCDLVRKLNDARQFQMRQTKKIDDILHTLKRLRELAGLVQDVETAEDYVRRSPEGLADGVPDHEQLQKTLDHAVLKYMRDSLQQLNAIMTDLDRYLESVKDSMPFMTRSLSTSQVDSIDKDDHVVGKKQELTVSSAPRSVDNSPTGKDRQQQIVSASNAQVMESSPRGRWDTTSASARPPSYASGSRSAQNSRSASPDKHHSRTSFSPVRKITNYPDPPPSFLISPPHQSSSRNSVNSGSQDGVNRTDMSEVYSRLARPQQLTKSISMDSAPLHSFTSQYATPTQLNQLPSALFATSASDSRNMNSSSLSPQHTGSLDRLSPRTARKKFFSEEKTEAPVAVGFHTWTDRKSSTQLTSDTHQENHRPQPNPPGYSSLPDRRSKVLAQSFDFNATDILPSPVDTDGVAPLDPHQIEMLYYPAHGAVARNLPPLPPMTWDEKVNLVDNTGIDPSEKSKTIGATSSQTKPFQVSQSKSATLGSLGAKEKRKFFRKSSSLDNTSVSASLGKVAMQILPPAVPTGFSPSDLIAAVKRKFRPNLKKTLTPDEGEAHPTPSIPISKSADNMADISAHPIRSLDSFQSTDVSPALTPSPTSQDISPFQTSDTQQHHGSDPQNSSDNPTSVPKLTPLFPKPPTPPNRRPPRRWRSKSADRAEKPDRRRQAPKPIIIHADIITPIKVWKFNETSV